MDSLVFFDEKCYVAHDNNGKDIFSSIRCKLDKSWRYVFLLLLMLMMAGLVTAQTTRTWVGGSEGSFNTASNWNPAGNGNNDIYVIDGNSQVTLNLSGDRTVAGLHVTGGADVTIARSSNTNFYINNGTSTPADLYVDGSSRLTFNYRIALTMGNTATGNVAGELVFDGRPISLTNGVITVGGTITNNGATITSTVSSFIFNDGSVYQHAMNGGTIPTATWGSASTVRVTGITTTAPSALSFNQSFGNLEIIGTLATSAVTLQLSENPNIGGNFYLEGRSTQYPMSVNVYQSSFTVGGTTTIGPFGRLVDNSGTGTNSFYGTVIVQNNGEFSTSSGSPYNFRGGITNNGTFFKTGSGAVTFAANPNQLLTGANAIDFSGNSSGSMIIDAEASLNIETNILFGGSTLTVNSTQERAIYGTSGTFTFNKNNGSQTIAVGGSAGDITFYDLVLTSNIKTLNVPITVLNNLTISPSTIVNLGSSSNTLEVYGNMYLDGTLDFGSNRAKTVTIKRDLIGDDGTITMQGNGLAHLLILEGENNALKTFSTTVGAGSIVRYAGNWNQQVFASNNYRNVEIDEGFEKTLQGNTIINDQLTLVNGVLQLDNYNLTLQSTSSMPIVGTVSNTNMIATDGTGYLVRSAASTPGIIFPVGAGGLYSPLTIDNIGTTAGTISVKAVKGELAPNFLDKYWDVIRSSSTPTEATISFEYNEMEGGFQLDTVYYSTPSSLWQGPEDDYAFGEHSFTVSNTSKLTTTSTYWTAAGQRNTYYSYQDGDWNLANTWTTTPDGSTLVGSQVPSLYDKVVILSDRTVYLPEDINTAGIALTIESGGILDMGEHSFTQPLVSLSGSGTLRLASQDFPTTAQNLFVNAGGGTVEYYNSTDFTLPATQTTYNNLVINIMGNTALLAGNLTMNGNLIIHNGDLQINNSSSTTPLSLTVRGNVTVDTDGEISVGTGPTNPAIGAITSGGSAPFTNYYNAFHSVVLYGDFTNNGRVRFTNLEHPIYNAFPSTSPSSTTGAATVYFMGATDNTLTANGVTDFYNLVVNKGSDQTNTLTVYSSAYGNFRLFGANSQAAESNDANANQRKALWIRTGTLVLDGMVIIPSLSEGTDGVYSNYLIAQNAALRITGLEVAVFSTADDYREVNTAYGVTAASNNAMGITVGNYGAMNVHGSLNVSNGILSTRESSGLIASNATGDITIAGGIVDTKQVLYEMGSARYEQQGGQLIVRGRLARTPLAYTSIDNLFDFSTATLSTGAANGINTSFAPFNIESASNYFLMSGGTIQIHDVTASAGTNAYEVNVSSANYSVSGGTLSIVPFNSDATAFGITSTTPLWNVAIDGTQTNSPLTLTSAFTVNNNFTAVTGSFNSNNNNLTIGGNVSLDAASTFTMGTTDTLTLNGAEDQLFTIDIAAPLNLNTFVISKLPSTVITLSGGQSTINIGESFILTSASMNDGGKTINVAGNVNNSGIIQGAGSVVLNGTDTQTIIGEGQFGNLTLNNTNAATAPISLGANTTVSGVLNFANDKLLDIGTNTIVLTEEATIQNAGATRYITSDGNAGDGGLTKFYGAGAASSFTFPIGADVYTSATLGFTSAPTTWGSVTVVPVSAEQPNVSSTGRGDNLTYYWKVKESGFVGIADGSITHSFVYDESDVVGTEANYVPAFFSTNSLNWNYGTTAEVDEATNTVSDWAGNGNTLAGDFTAGIESSFNISPRIFYSRQDGVWTDVNTWSLTGHDDGANIPTSVPGINDIVIIGGQDSVWLYNYPNSADRANSDRYVANCATLMIEQGSFLDVQYNPGSTFTTVANHPNGNGIFRVSSMYSVVPEQRINLSLPHGDFTAFNVNGGTTEIYSITDLWNGPTYILPANVSSYGNLILNTNGDDINFPASDVTIYGDLVTRGKNTNAWYRISNADNNPKTLTVHGNIDIQGGSLLWSSNTAQVDVVVYGDLKVGVEAAFFNQNGLTDPTNPNSPSSNPSPASIRIGGSVINDANGLINNATNNRLAKCDFSGINVTFFGDSDAKITNTTGSDNSVLVETIFGKSIIVDKGSNATLTIDVAGRLVTNTANWLTLNSGTLIYNRPNPATDFVISTNRTFTIPSTAALVIDYTNANNTNVLIGNNASNDNDLLLSGRLAVANGNLYVGQVTAPNYNNDIEYSGVNSVIEVTGGNLTVNGQIRRPSNTTNDVLSYTQSAGNVTINGRNALVSRAKLEVLNNGSFNMSGGTLTIVRGGGTNYGDLYLRPATATSNVTGGTIIFAHDLSNLAQSYSLESTIPLYNVTITGRTSSTAANATVSLMTSPLTIKGNLTLTNARSIFNASNRNLTIGGNFENNGTYTFGTNTTTFNGASQTISGTSTTDFNNLVVSSSSGLTVPRSFSVNKNLTITSGTLTLGGYGASVGGNFTNNGAYSDNDSNGSGIILDGSTLQQIRGAGSYDRLELDNLQGARVYNDITLSHDLVLTHGVLDLGSYQLLLSASSSIVAGNIFGVSNMIITNGVVNSLGVRKYFGAGAENFTFPIGVTGKYTPVVFDITESSRSGFVSIVPVNAAHTGNGVVTNDLLRYYWHIAASMEVAATARFYYNDADVGGTEANYLPSRLLTQTDVWYQYSADDVDEATNEILFTFPSGTTNLDGDYTAGTDESIDDRVPRYQSNRDGDWSDPDIWTALDGSRPCPAGGPIGANIIVDHDVTIDVNNTISNSVTINGTLRVNSTTGHNFTEVIGSGTLYLETGTLPGGDYSSFTDCSGNATIEYGGTGDYTVVGTLYDNIPNLLFSGTGTRTLPNKDLTICKSLIIDGPTVNNSANNKDLYIGGTFERLSGAFTSGTGTVVFNGTEAQNVGNFNGGNSFYNLLINNAEGLTVEDGAVVEVSNTLYLTNGVINTTDINRLIISNTSANAVSPSSGGATSYVNGPLTKSMTNGSSFVFPIGSGTTKSHNFTVTAGATVDYTAQYFTPNAMMTLVDPITSVNTEEYWGVTSSSVSSASVSIAYDNTSGLTPSMVVGGMSSLRVTEYASAWSELASTTTGNSAAGVIAMTGTTSLSSTVKYFTSASTNTAQPRASFQPLGGGTTVCGVGEEIPVKFSSSSVAIGFPITLTYSIGNVLQPVITINEQPLSLAITATIAGEYQLRGFTYNDGIDGVVDESIITVNAYPPTPDAGADQSLCGLYETVLAANNPGAGYSGLWTIITGSGGQFIDINGNTMYNAGFRGLSGETYTLRWTVSNGNCSVSDDVVISFPVAPLQPGNFTAGLTSVCAGSTQIYTVPYVAGITYSWSYSGTGATITGTGNSVSIHFANDATSGVLSVSSVNSCGTSEFARTMSVTVVPLPSPSIIGTNNVCPNLVGSVYTVTENVGSTYAWAVTGGNITAGEGTNSITVTWGNTGTGVVSVTETNNSGCVGTASLNVDISDTENPVITEVPSDISVNVDDGACNAVVTWTEPTITDNCTPDGSLVIVRSHTSGSTFSVGTPTVVTYTVTDASGNTATAQFTVTVIDNIDPVITLPEALTLDITLGCEVALPAIAAMATDNCSGSVTIIQSPVAGTMLTPGGHVITITATDVAGNDAIENFTVTVTESIAPVISRPADRTVDLNANCEAVVPNFLDGLSVSDNCTTTDAIVLVQTPAAGTTITGRGTTLVTITATDLAGNTATVSDISVLARDVTAPTVVGRDLTVYLDANGQALISGADLNNGSSDNCDADLTFIASRAAFSCADIGTPVPITLTARDDAGLTGTANVTVTVLDNIAPTINLSNSYVLTLGATGTATLLPENVNNGSSDNCRITSMRVEPNQFDCGDLGEQTVTLYATDASGNESSATTTITVATSLQITDIRLSSCDLAFGFSLFFNAVVTGGDGDYSYYWESPNSSSMFYTFPLTFRRTDTRPSPTFNNLVGNGNYEIRLTVTDGNGCSVTRSFNFDREGLQSNNVAANHSTACEGETRTYSAGTYDADITYTWLVENGTILTENTNTNEVEVRWDLGVTSGVISARLQEEDLMGSACERAVIDSVTISASPVPVFTEPINRQLCGGTVATYSLTETYSSYEWTVTGGTVTQQNGNQVTVRWNSDVTTGRVLAVVHNVNGCSGSVFFDVTIDNVTATATSTNVTCHGADNGTITVTAAGGTGPGTYRYLLTWGANSRPAQESNVFTSLAPGSDYVVTVIDNNGTGCQVVVNNVPTITEPSALVLTVAPFSNVSCYGGNDGMITVTATGGSGIYHYSLDGINFQEQNVFNGLTAGTYTIYVRDESAPTCVTSVTHTLTQPVQLVGTCNVTNINCYGSSTGSVVITGSGGSGANTYHFSTDGTNFTETAGNSYTYNNIAAGDYTYYIRDNNCTAEVNFTVEQPAAALTVDNVPASQVNVLCNGGNTGSITVLASGGTAGYQYSLTGGAPWQTSATFTDLVAGDYTVTVMDAAGCTDNTTIITVTQPDPITVTLTPTHVTIFGQSTGRIVSSVRGGTAPYTYAWSNGRITANISSLSAGTYTLTVTDDNGCESEPQSVTITQPERLVATINAADVTNVTCYGGNDGSARVTVTGGTEPYYYSWNTSPQQTTATASNLRGTVSGRTYTVTVTDAAGADAAAEVVIYQPAQITFTSVVTPVLCFGQSTGSITVNATGGSGTFSYSRDGGTTYQSSNIFENLPAGTYSIVVSDINNCVSSTVEVTVAQPATSLQGSVTAQTNILCNGGDNGSVTVTGSGGAGGYRYSIDGGANYFDSGTFENLRVGNYTVIVSDANGCQYNVTVSITEPTALNATIGTITPVSCFGTNTGAVTISASGGTSTYSYSLDGGPYVANGTFGNLAAGEHTIVVRDANQCTTEPVNFNVDSPAQMVVTPEIVTNVACSGETGSIRLNVTGGTAPYTYIFNGITQDNATFTVGSGTFDYSVTDSQGCTPITGRLVVPVTDNVPPVASCKPATIYLNVSGNATLTVDDVNNGSFDHCGIATISLSQETFTCDNLGTNTVTMTVEDTNGNTNSCDAIVTVVDEIDPTITAPANITGVSTDAGQCYATGVDLGTPTTNDNCTVASITNNAPTQFPLGTTTVTWTVTDGSGRTATATQMVTVVDTQAPTITCPTNITVNTDDGQNYATVTIALPIITDCSTFTYSNDFNNGEDASGQYPVGTTTVTYRAVDANANEVTCSFTVSVTDDEVPTITCGDNRIVNLPAGETTYTHSGTSWNVTATDNVGVQSLTYALSGATTTVNGGNSSLDGQVFNEGVSTVTWTANDANDNEVTCSFTVTVRPTLEVSIAGTDMSCYTGNDGSATATATGGTEPYAYSWNTTPIQTGATINNLAQGIYNVTVTDANGYTATASITINRPTQITFTTDVTSVLCHGESTGAIVVNATGGTGTLRYSSDGGNTYQTSNTFGSLPAGVYYILVSDENGCLSNSSEITITQPATGLGGSVTSQTNVRCSGENNGSVTVTGSGGAGEYQYSIDGGDFQNFGTFGSLRAGGYIVTVRDMNGCRFDVTVTITEPMPLIIARDGPVVLVSCYGGNNGSVSVSASGGISPYSYSINGGLSFQASGTFSGLSAGDYTIIVRDANECTNSTNVTITQPMAMTVTPLIDTPITCADDMGTIRLSTRGGTRPYTFTFNGVTQADSVFTIVATGTYNYSVTDVNMCDAVTGTLTVSVIDNELPVAICRDITLNLGVDGTATITSDDINNSSRDNCGIASISLNVIDFDCGDLGDNDVTMTVEDTNGNISTCVATVTVVDNTSPQLIGTAPAGATGISACYVNATTPPTGTPAFDATAVAALYTDNCSTPTVTLTNTAISGDDSGWEVTYTYTVSDGNGNDLTGERIVHSGSDQSAPYLIGAAPAGTTGINACFVNATTPPTGTPAFDATAVAALYTDNCGTPTVTLTNTSSSLDVNGCDWTVTYTYSVSDGINTLLGEQIIHSGRSTTLPSLVGAAPVGMTNINACYVDAVTPPTGTPAFNADDIASYYQSGCGGNLTATLIRTDVTGNSCGWTVTYTYNVIDACGNTLANEIITHGGNDQSAPILTCPVNISLSTDAGHNYATVIVPLPTVSDNCGNVTYTNDFNGTANASGQYPLGVTTVTYTAEDVCGNTNQCSFTVTVIDNEPPVIDCITNRVASEDAGVHTYTHNGTGWDVTATDNDEVASLTYAMSGATTDVTGENTSLSGQIFNAGITTVTWTATDESGLTTTCSYTVNITNQLAVSIVATNVTCFGAEDGSATAIVSGGTAPYRYSWNTSPVRPDQRIDGLNVGRYTVTVTDANNFTASESVDITQPQQLTISHNETNVNCYGANTGAITIGVGGGTAPYTYNLSGSLPITTSDITYTFDNLIAGQYTIRVTDANGCVTTPASTRVTVSEPLSGVSGTTTINQHVRCYGYRTGSVTIVPDGGMGAPYQFSIDGGITFSSVNTFTGLRADSTYSAFVRDRVGCLSDPITVYLPPPTEITTTLGAFDNITCNGGTTIIELLVAGGTQPYNYSVDGSTTPSVSPMITVGAGSHMVVITDRYSCPDTVRFTLTEPAPLQLNIDNQTNIVCADDLGSITVSATGGVGGYQYSIDGGAYGDGRVFNNLTEGDHQISVRSGDNCFTSITRTITAIPFLTGNIISSTNVTCNGGNNGSITVQGADGTGPYSYRAATDGQGAYSEPVAAGTSYTITGLAAGTYTVYIRDANNCEFILASPVTIMEPTAITYDGSSITAVTCFEGDDGAVNLTVSGGSGLYNYLWNTGAVTEDISNLTSGIYIVTITDQSDLACSVIATFEVSQPDEIPAPTVVDVETCSYDPIVVAGQVTGATETVYWSTDNATFTTEVPASPTSTTTYYVYQSDGTCNSDTVSFTVTVRAVIPAPTVVDAEICSYGTIAVEGQVTGATETVYWSTDNAAFSTAVPASPTSTTTYYVYQSDGTCNSDTVNFTVTILPVVPSLGVTDATICSYETISLAGQVTGLSEGGTIYWSDDNGVTFSTTEPSSPTGTTTYSVFQMVGVCNSDTVSFTVTVSPTIPALSVTDVTLCNDATIDITTLVTDITETLYWSVDNVNFDTTVPVAPTTTTTYYVYQTNGTCNSDTTTFTVTFRDEITATAIITNATCETTTGSIDVTVTGGSGAYAYSWLDATDTEIAASEDITDVASGTYRLIVTDVNLCSATFTYEIVQPLAITFFPVTVTNVTCFGTATGAVDLTVAGGSGDFNYRWLDASDNEIATTEDLVDVVAGTYRLFVTDLADLSCNADTTITITQPDAALTGSASVTTAITCNGGTATVMLIAAGGTTPYFYTFNDSTNNTGVFTTVAGDDMAYSITDANNCTAITGTIDVSQPEPIVITFPRVVNVLVFGQATGSVQAVVAGGLPPYVYSWDTDPVQTTPTISNLIAGEYTLTVTDANGCVKVASVNITQPGTPLTVRIVDHTNISCFGEFTGTITAEGAGGIEPYSYSINGGAYQTSGTFTELGAGDYTVTVRDSIYSTATATVSITQPSAALAVTITKEDVICFGEASGTATATASGGVGPYSYLWNTATAQPTATANALAAGTYTVTVTDRNGCTAEASVTIDQSPALNVTVTTTDVSCNGVANGTAKVTVGGGTGVYSYTWDGGATTDSIGNLAAGSYTVIVSDGNCTVTSDFEILEPDAITLDASTISTQCPDSKDGSITLAINGGTAPYSIFWSDGATTQNRSNIAAGTYSVVVSDTNSCAVSLDVTVDFNSSPDCVTFPSIITPNNDGYNDEWIISNIWNYPDAELKIYTRWGKLIYHSKNISENPWDGTFNGVVMPTDSYHFIMNLHDGSDLKSGIVTLIK